MQAYGLTETTGAITVLEAQDHDPGPRPVIYMFLWTRANHKIKIVDKDSGAEVPEGEVGEICVLGPQTMKCYWLNEEATNECYTDDWFHTGDVGYLADGYLYIHDRAAT